MSSYRSQNLFGSGPHRFSLARQGELTVPAYVLNGSGSGSLLMGGIELDVVITGRLTASSQSALWSLRDAITAMFTQPPTPGTLIDQYGRTWTNMTFITFQELDRTDRGRTVSLGYKAVFRRIA